MKINIPTSAKAYYASKMFFSNPQNILVCYSNEDDANAGYQQLIHYGCNDVFHLPLLKSNPYDHISQAKHHISKRARILAQIATSRQPKIIPISAENLLLKIPSFDIFTKSIMKVSAGDKVGPDKVIDFLVYNGYCRASSAIEDGEFAVRGEIIDIATTNNEGYRINFGWDNIENIRRYDSYTQISSEHLAEITLFCANETLINTNTISNFKKNFLATFGANHVNSSLYQSIINGMPYNGYEYLTPLFYDKMSTISSELESPTIIYDALCIKKMEEYHQLYRDIYHSRQLTNKSQASSFYYAIEPDLLINNYQKTREDLQKETNIYIDKSATPLEQFISVPHITSEAKIKKKSEFEILFEIIDRYKKTSIIFCNSSKSLDRIKTILTNYERSSNKIEYIQKAQNQYINLIVCPITQSFSDSQYLFISEFDLLGSKFLPRKKISSKKKLANMLTEIDNITQGDLVVHKEHGIGMFDSIETLSVDNIKHDCIKILYADKNIFYLPVENINQLKKHGNNDVPLDKLGHVEWQKRTAKLKNKIRDIAKKLLQITAKRQLIQIEPVHVEALSYENFCKDFPYTETEDQQTAINDIQNDLTSGKLMDRLICGDVGFGKTEVAMRATYLVASNINTEKAQIAIISPTTILCRQHYKNFMSRFRNTKLKIAQLSRLIKPSETRKIKTQMEEGEIDIVIGTHSLLASSIKFKNLKMVIIDEEQHFGVTQKERLKRLKIGTHVLSISATPIPRTLQMSMVGIKDLSLITTPPIDRLLVRTNIISNDDVIIRDALMRERLRGGLSFYVTPRVKDIETITKQLDKIVPELNYRVAHGQMKPSDIDNIMNDFCEEKFDILISTTIIESGIDIENANTLIINKADMLGLSQLYQLRGRVGRGKKRGYAYLVLEGKQIRKHSIERLEILQNLDSLGAGFSIASHDMDLRGFGNLVGDEQSGHIKEVGSELYQEMLDEEILKLKQNKEIKTNFVPKINLKIPVLIPEKYIEDSDLRMAIYRKAGNIESADEMHNFKIEMEDRFGPIPSEFLNLLKSVEIRNICLKLGIESLDSGKNGFVIKFNDNFDVAGVVMQFINKYPRDAKIKAGNKLVYLKPLTEKRLISDTMEFLANFEGK